MRDEGVTMVYMLSKGESAGRQRHVVAFKEDMLSRNQQRKSACLTVTGSKYVRDQQLVTGQKEPWTAFTREYTFVNRPHGCCRAPPTRSLHRKLAVLKYSRNLDDF